MLLDSAAAGGAQWRPLRGARRAGEL